MQNEKYKINTENPNIVDHLRHPLALKIRDLLLREKRIALKQIIIDDEENILQALAAHVNLLQIFTSEREKLSKEFCNKLPSAVPIIDISKRTGKKIFGNEKASKLFAIAQMPKPIAIESLQTMQKDFIVLDKVSISGNIGAMMRTSLALDVGAMILLNSDPADNYDRRIIRASRGYVFKIKIININTSDFIRFCQRHQIKILATTSHADIRIDEAAQEPHPLGIVFGSEKEGCSQALFDAANIKAKIPMHNAVESLNVSAAASIILYLRSRSVKS